MAHGGGREPLGQVRRRPFDAVRRHPDQQAGRALQSHMTSLRERTSPRLWSTSGLPRGGGLFCRNDGQAPSHARAKARVAMTGASSTSPSSAIARSGSSGHESLRSIEKRRRRQRGLELPPLKEDEADADEPRRHFHSISG